MSQPAEKRMGVSDARANMTEVIAEVRLLGTPVVLTRREKPQAVLVSHEFYEQAQRNRALLRLLRKRAGEAAGSEHEALRHHSQVVIGWLDDAEASLKS